MILVYCLNGEAAEKLPRVYPQAVRVSRRLLRRFLDGTWFEVPEDNEERLRTRLTRVDLLLRRPLWQETDYLMAYKPRTVFHMIFVDIPDLPYADDNKEEFAECLREEQERARRRAIATGALPEILPPRDEG